MGDTNRVMQEKQRISMVRPRDLFDHRPAADRFKTEFGVQTMGFARVITDYATTYYLCDVIIDADYRGRGLGTALISHIESRPEYAGLRGLLLTRDAHGLYAKFGFETVSGRAMVK